MNMIMYILYRVVYRPWGIGHPVRFIQLGNHVKIAIDINITGAFA